MELVANYYYHKSWSGTGIEFIDKYKDAALTNFSLFISLFLSSGFILACYDYIIIINKNIVDIFFFIFLHQQYISDNYNNQRKNQRNDIDFDMTILMMMIKSIMHSYILKPSSVQLSKPNVSTRTRQVPSTRMFSSSSPATDT